MITLIVGHRGVGKTSLLKRVQQYQPACQIFDLDAEIAQKEGAPVSEIFATHGEGYFRKKEAECLHALVENLSHQTNSRAYISLGAGYQGNIPQNVRVLWLARPTDSAGRSFLNRPRLSPDLRPLEEYQHFYKARHARYAQISHEVYLQSEGFTFLNKAEEQIFCQGISALGGALTILPNHVSSQERWSQFIGPRLKWGLKYFELRDDLLNEEQINLCLQYIPQAQLIFSYRSADKAVATSAAAQRVALVDWPLELGTPRAGLKHDILSLHERKNKTVAESIEFLHAAAKDEKKLLKLAIEINNLSELKAGHAWAALGGDRIFLPRSASGRWAWYRLLMKNKFKINFLREGEGSSLDQPTLADWLRFNPQYPHFSAILGQPVAHSWTCAEHFFYFQKKSMNILRIDLSEEEWAAGALSTLKDLGLTHAAVTSPLKRLAFASCQNPSTEAERFQSVNTLCLQGHEWCGHNTDFYGFQALLKSAKLEGRVGIWGGGGTLPILRASVPPASLEFSARTGTLRDDRGAVHLHSADIRPDVLIWASSGANQRPPKEWSLRQVIDLNYSESSPGLEYCVENKIKYISGLEMFLKQAEQQRKFWDECK